jgi:hypothetical protein
MFHGDVMNDFGVVAYYDQTSPEPTPFDKMVADIAKRAEPGVDFVVNALGSC